MWWSALILGLISSTHCLGMCGSLQGAFVSMFLKKGKWQLLLIYHSGRIFTYALLGLLAGTFGMASGLQNWQQQTSIISGLLLLCGFVAFYLLKLDQKLFKLLFPYIQKIRKRLQDSREKQWLYFAGSGALNGVLPCAMVYLAILPATSSGSPQSGGLYMLLFGLGTLPLLLLSNIGIMRFFQQNYRLGKKLASTIIVLTAVLLILRGMDLDIPFISPNSSIKPEQALQGCQ